MKEEEEEEEEEERKNTDNEKSFFSFTFFSSDFIIFKYFIRYCRGLFEIKRKNSHK